MITINTIDISTPSGQRVSLVFGTTGDGRLLTTASGAVKGYIEAVYPVPPGSGMPHEGRRARNVTHYTMVGDQAVALDALAAQRISEAMDAAKIRAIQIRGEADAELCAAVRATGSVRRVLRYSPAWPDIYGLDEAYPPSPGSGFADWVRFGLPGVKGTAVHPRCPSLPAIQARSEPWGAFPGHTNSLRLISDTDCEILVIETIEKEREDAARLEARCRAATANQMEMEEVAIPPLQH
jgi:hypothetical protein